jgi:hypothetical protein
MSRRLWGTPPVKGTYQYLPPSKAGHYNGRDFASTASNAVMASGAFVATAAALDNYVMEASSGLTLAAGVRIWLIQNIFFVVLKVLASILRSDAAGWFRDVCAWGWEWVVARLRSLIWTKVREKVNPIDEESRKKRQDRRQSRRTTRRERRASRSIIKSLFFTPVK